MTRGPLEVRSDGSVSCDAVLWRSHGRLWLTVVAKATYAMNHAGTVTPLSPDAIAKDDVTFDRNPTRSVEIAGELAPLRKRCDVTFVGHAYAPGGVATPTAAVKLALFRDGRPAIERVVHVFGDRDPSGTPRPFMKMPLVYERAFGGPGNGANPVGSDKPNLVDPKEPTRPACMGPVSRFWPSRKRLLGGIDRKALEGPVLDVPASMPWEYFQSAPLDLQTDLLQGGEWLVLDGLHPTLPRVQTQLAPSRAVARLVSKANAPEPIELVADALAIDGERGVVSLVFRGPIELAGGEETLRGLAVEVALESPGKPVEWPSAAREEEAPSSAPPALEPDGTVSVVAAVADAKAIPFAAVAGARAAPASTATPWANAPLPRPRTAPVGESTVTAADAASEGTIALQGGAHAAALARPVAPFPLRNAEGRATSAAATPWGAQPVVAPLRSAPGEATLSPAEFSPRPMFSMAQPASVQPIEPPAPSIPRPPLMGTAPVPVPPPAKAARPEATDDEVAAVLRKAGAREEDIRIILEERAFKRAHPSSR